jgi:predicted RNA binding protein YcfA (HicA-like mRNA interferase family)
MKRTEFIRHIEGHGCQLIREGGRHAIYFNPARRKTAPVPRHQEIDGRLARGICKELEIPPPAGR